MHEFTGIPYAKQPLGPLRFSPPQLYPLPDIVNATSTGKLCPSLSADFQIVGSENCLTLDLFIPGDSGPRIVRPKPLYPVLVWFVGEGLDGPRNNIYPIHLVANHKLIVVVVRYRSGPLGFIHYSIFGEDNLTEKIGNVGLLDQKRALEWVSEYVSEFGGDKNRVTILGQSITASYLLTHIKQSYRTHFHQMILHGGPMASQYSYWTDSQSKDVTSKLLKKLDCEGETSLACLRERTVEEILRANAHVKRSQGLWERHWRPTVGSPLLANNLQNSLRVALLPPMLIGSNTAEGGIFISNDASLNDNHKTLLDVVIDSDPYFHGRADNSREFVRFQYEPRREDGKQTTVKQAAMDFVGDSFITCPTNLLANTVSQNNKIYRYVFGYQEVISSRIYPVGVTHGDETMFLSGG